MIDFSLVYDTTSNQPRSKCPSTTIYYCCIYPKGVEK